METFTKIAPIIVPTMMFVAVCVIAGRAVLREQAEERHLQRHRNQSRKHA